VKPFLVVNPASAAGRTGRHFDEIARAVREVVGDFGHAFTAAPGDGVRIAREAAAAGHILVVAVGGDGTAHEVVNGIFEAGRPGVVFGLIPRGTGGDLRRSMGLPEDLAGAARALAGGVIRSCDVGRVEFSDHQGARATRHFINVADLGVGGEVAQEVNRGGKALGGKLAFMLGTAKVLVRYSDRPMRYRFDGGAWAEERLTALCVCNGRYFGGGMQVAPGATMDDGLFDVTLWKGMGIGDFALRSRRLYDGTHLQLAGTRTLRAREVEVEPLGDRPVLLDVDGEGPGRAPARFSLLPGALPVQVAR
jgi:YegS/Rv2252/BmrU family lipid kinase